MRESTRLTICGGEDFVFGATGRGSTTYVHAAIIKKALAASFDIVTGFKGVAGINSAILRNEIDGRCGVPLSRFLRPATTQR